MTVTDLSRVCCAYCTNRAHAVEWEGDQCVPICRAHFDARNVAPNAALRPDSA